MSSLDTQQSLNEKQQGEKIKESIGERKSKINLVYSTPFTNEAKQKKEMPWKPYEQSISNLVNQQLHPALCTMDQISLNRYSTQKIIPESQSKIMEISISQQFSARKSLQRNQILSKKLFDANGLYEEQQMKSKDQKQKRPKTKKLAIFSSIENQDLITKSLQFESLFNPLALHAQDNDSTTKQNPPNIIKSFLHPAKKFQVNQLTMQQQNCEIAKYLLEDKSQTMNEQLRFPLQNKNIQMNNEGENKDFQCETKQTKNYIKPVTNNNDKKQPANIDPSEYFRQKTVNQPTINRKKKIF